MNVNIKKIKNFLWPEVITEWNKKRLTYPKEDRPPFWMNWVTLSWPCIAIFGFFMFWLPGPGTEFMVAMMMSPVILGIVQIKKNRKIYEDQVRRWMA